MEDLYNSYLQCQLIGMALNIEFVSPLKFRKQLGKREECLSESEKVGFCSWLIISWLLRDLE